MTTNAAVAVREAPTARMQRTTGLLIVIAAALAQAGYFLWRDASALPSDLRVYLWGGRAIVHNTALYGIPAYSHYLFTYPPFAAVVFTPLSLLPSTVARVAWSIASIAALVWATSSALRLGGFRRTPLAFTGVVAATLALEPVRHTLLLGQINLILLALVLWDIDRVARGRRAGVGIGIAMAIKLVPALFVVLLIATRRWRDATIACGTAAVATALGFAVAPAASTEYWRHEFFDTGRVGVPYISNQSVLGASARLLRGRQHVAAWWYLPIIVVVAVLGVAVAARYARRADWLTAAAACGVTSLLVSPVSWTHHWVWAMPALLVLVRRGSAGGIAALVGYAVFVLAPMWWTPRSGGPDEYGWHGAESLVANLYLVAAAVFLMSLTRRVGYQSRLGYGRSQ